MHDMLVDRFGRMPDEVERLFDSGRISNVASRLGFDKIIVKNGILIAFFIANQMSPYYKSATYQKVFEKAMTAGNGRTFEFKESNNRLKLISRDVSGTSAALSLLYKLC